jgi:predicted house-cleaning noncanonical NTP pyrophosphatase (MazG superfamily)
MAIKSFKMEKLIRDRIPSFLEAKGIMVNKRIMDQDEFIQKLKDKLLEEAKEVKQAQKAEELLEELADILEVLQTLSSASGFTMQQIEQKRMEKCLLKGGFEDRLYSDYIEIEENNQEMAYYLNNAKPYQAYEPVHKDDCLFCQMATGKREVDFFAKFQHCYIIKDKTPQQFPPANFLV